MARSEDDLFTVRMNLSATVSLDWERIEADPVFRTILTTSIYPAYGEPENDEQQKAVRLMALESYLAHYIVRERFLRDAPSTNGPGTLLIEQIEYLGNN